MRIRVDKITTLLLILTQPATAADWDFHAIGDIGLRSTLSSVSAAHPEIKCEKSVFPPPPDPDPFIDKLNRRCLSSSQSKECEWNSKIDRICSAYVNGNKVDMSFFNNGVLADAGTTVRHSFNIDSVASSLEKRYGPGRQGGIGDNIVFIYWSGSDYDFSVPFIAASIYTYQYTVTVRNSISAGIVTRPAPKINF